MPSPHLDFLAPYQADLDDLRGRDRLRALSKRGGLDFASNDYLGLAESEEYREAARAALSRGFRWGPEVRGFCAEIMPSMRRWR